MDLKEIKKITSFAQKHGVKMLSFGDFKIEFHEDTPIQMKAPKLVRVQEEAQVPKTPQDPSLQEINDYIYGNQVTG
jgi:hypothetical protein